MQNQDHYGSGLNSNSQRVLLQPSNHLNQSMSSYSFVRYQPNNSIQLMANTSTHQPPQTSSYTPSQVHSWPLSCEPQQNSHVQQSHHHPSQQQISQQQLQQHQRLKVEDALSYLDQVKLKFGHQPQVYNEFLDIMKEFKSQVIDTPGVIKKVSMLFQGHTELIVGFNTFLPQGYSIEVRENQTINVRQPGQQHVVPLINLNNSIPIQAHVPPSVHQPTHNVRQNTVPEIPQTASQGQPVQFNHAINYVNKIKSCYQGRPEIYKSFLDILHNYQKEQKILKEGTRQGNKAPVSEAEVYSQVSQLFNDQPELLMEFRQFLPDANGGNEFMRGLGVHENIQQGNADTQHRIPQNSNATSSTKFQSQNKGGISINSPIRSKSSSVACSAPPPTKRQKLSFQKSNPREPLDGIDLACHDSELTKFVRKMVAQCPSRELQCRDLLKHVDMVSRKLVDISELYRVANPLIEKMPELKPYIRNLLARHDPTGGFERRVTLPEKFKEPERHEEHFPDLSTCPQYGKHYRILPSDYAGEKSSNCSEIYRNVLNETHAIYATSLSETEIDGDHSLRRNIYEDHVFQCEDERYEMDMVVDLNSSVLKGLKKLMPKIQKMNSEDLSKCYFEDLGSTIGVSEVHIETAMKRLYGEKFMTMMEGLRKCPGTAVPLVIKSMQVKDEEWKMAKKSFERIWSEQMDKFYLKSLDFQGLKFKQNDIKSIRSKSLIKEIENLYNEQNNAEKMQYDECSMTDKRGHTTTKGLRLKCHDKPSYDDAVMLLLSSVSRQSAIQVDDQDRIRNVLINFLPSIIFSTNQNPVKLDVKQEHECSDDEEEEEEDGSRKAGTDAKAKIRMKSEVTSDNENFLCEVDQAHARPQCFYMNDNWYILIRLLVILCERLHLFKEKSCLLFEEEEVNRELRSGMMTHALQARCPESLDPNSYYAMFLTMVKNLANGLLESSLFEDQLREMFGINSYVAFTIDKLILNIVKQLQHVTSKEECLTLGDHYESVLTCDCTFDQYEQKVRDLMAEKLCFKLNIGKNSDGKVELCCIPIHPMLDDSQSCAVNRHDTATLSSCMDARSNSMEDVEANDFCMENTATQDHQTLMKGRRKRRKSTEVRNNNAKGFGLDESAYSFRSMPDFFRKFKQRFSLIRDKSCLLRPESMPQNCMVQALESMASSHPVLGSSPHLRSDYDNDTADNCLNEESSDGSQKILHDKFGDKSEDDSSWSGSYRRFAIKTGTTEIHVCRPGCMERSRKNNCKIHLVKKRKFDKWKNKWDCIHLNDDMCRQYAEVFVSSSTPFGLLDIITTCHGIDPQAFELKNHSPQPSSSPQSANQKDVFVNPNCTQPEQPSEIQKDVFASPTSPTYECRSPTYSPASPSYQPCHPLHNNFQPVRNENNLSLS